MNSACKPELMSPAGNMESVPAAVENGCTAIYAGATEFNARYNAKNFTVSELESAIDYCHLRGVKLYVTANTLIKNNEISQFLSFVESMYLIGADGIIVQDIGCALLIKKHFPDFYLLASTQMTVHNASGADFLYRHGFDRIVLSRELSVSEIAAISGSVKVETECFIHGALCVCYSGQCLLSAFNGGRSGNRGVCAQPCRLQYGLLNGGMEAARGAILSPKDAIGLYALPGLIESGVNSFKIEGRMKGAEYVAGVTSVYRKYIDLYFDNPSEYRVNENDVIKLAAIFNRGGFNRGYYQDYSGKHMLTGDKVGSTGVYIGKVSKTGKQSAFFKTHFDVFPGDGVEIQNSGAYITKSYKKGELAEVSLKGNINNGAPVYRTYDKKLMDELRASYAGNKRKLEINGHLYAKQDKPVSLSVLHGEMETTVYADVPETAETAAATHNTVMKQLAKTGNTPFRFGSLNIELDKGIFLNNSELNKLRRTALSELEKKITAKYKRSPRGRKPSAPVNVLSNKVNKEYTVLVRNQEQLRTVSVFNFSRLYVDFEADPRELDIFRKKGISVYKCLNRIERGGERCNNDSYSDYNGLLIRTYGQAAQLNDKYEFAADYTLNIFNCLSAKFWTDKKFKSVCVSPELSSIETGKISENTEVVRYGKIPLMTTVQCPIGNFCADKSAKPFCRHKNRGGAFKLINQKAYDLIPVCDKCYCLILASNPINLTDKPLCRYHRIEFSNEGWVDVKNIMSIYTGSSC